MNLFLTPEEVCILTGRTQKSKQVQQLRASGIPFTLNACGQPVVTRSAVEGGKRDEQAGKKPWRSAALGT
ncbi:DUF4224 domain-containing protein [Ferrovum myxofaciens]|uniref:DUF4224 domain-containing protein n=1 Tax=Ferrovum myxofaciens TaxID=416213 RepID=UPI003985A8AB